MLEICIFHFESGVSVRCGDHALRIDHEEEGLAVMTYETKNSIKSRVVLETGDLILSYIKELGQ